MWHCCRNEENKIEGPGQNLEYNESWYIGQSDEYRVKYRVINKWCQDHKVLIWKKPKLYSSLQTKNIFHMDLKTK